MRSQRCWLLGGIAGALLVGCGTANVMERLDEPPAEAVEPLSVPSVRLVSPPVWKAGEVVTVLGSDFAPSERGFTMVRFDGVFIEDGGQSRDVSMSVRTTYRNPGRVELVFEPAYPPAGFGHDIGRFSGQIVAMNADLESVSEPSAPVAAEVEVGPSLIIWGVRPESVECADEPRIDATLDGETLLVDVEAIGLTPAAAYTPLEFGAAFVDFAEQAQEVSERLTGGRRARLRIEPGKLPMGMVEDDLGVNLRVVDGRGVELERRLSVSLGREYSVAYDGNIHIAELYAPVQVSSCLPGGEYGRDVTYSASESETRSRSVGFSVNVGISLWVVNAGFGINVSETVSSAASESLSLSGRIPPGQFGVFYRQTQRLERIGHIVRRDRCGAVFAIGDARVTDWNWAPDLAVTANGDCPPAPPSNFPPAQVFP